MPRCGCWACGNAGVSRWTRWRHRGVPRSTRKRRRPVSWCACVCMTYDRVLLCRRPLATNPFSTTRQPRTHRPTPNPTTTTRLRHFQRSTRTSSWRSCCACWTGWACARPPGRVRRESGRCCVQWYRTRKTTPFSRTSRQSLWTTWAGGWRSFPSASTTAWHSTTASPRATPAQSGRQPLTTSACIAARIGGYEKTCTGGPA